MPKRSKKHVKKSRISKSQKMYVMKGCAEKSRKNRSKKVFSSLGKSGCPKCGTGCMCGPICNCPHKCPGNCYLNRSLKGKKHKGGAGCGAYGCPIAPFSWAQMNAMQGGNQREGGARKQKGGLKYPPPNNVMPTGHVLPYGKNPLGSIGQMGGSCGPSCGLQPPLMQAGGGQKGGGYSFFKPAPPMPGPIVGSAWGTSINKWPGMDGISGNRNYLKSYDATNNIIIKDPQLQQLTADIDAGYKTLSSMVGGYKYKNRAKKGGGIIPQDLVNLGQDFTFNLKSAYNSLNGYNAPVNPLPYKDQLPQSLNSTRMLL